MNSFRAWMKKSCVSSLIIKSLSNSIWVYELYLACFLKSLPSSFMIFSANLGSLLA
ncbi:hypothetical protein [Campylobacter ureolyticus]|uniref:hypothetical protein n=1 Tax=Campylobacter ureolyticus TaxID=827 RepID=UPI00146B8DE8|nr:hypothetical protein [Campylobacter ureolyticus]